MTSEGPQHPGYEPDEAAPDAGGPRRGELDPRRRPAGESWAPPGYDPPQRTDQWNPPGAQPAPWGAGPAQGHPGDRFGGQADHGGARPPARPGRPTAVHPGSGADPPSRRADPAATPADPGSGRVVRRLPARRGTVRRWRLRCDRLPRQDRIPAERAAAAHVE
ncbi:hypothetical protein GCM10009687_14200 [Asanoa iriomotensis]